MKAGDSDAMNESKLESSTKPTPRKFVRPFGIAAVKSKIPKQDRTVPSPSPGASRESVVSRNQESAPKRIIENQFNIKQKRYASLKKEIFIKEKCCSVIYAELQELRDKMVASGGKDPFSEELMSSPTILHQDLLSQCQTGLAALPDVCLDACREVLDKRNAKLISWIETLQSDGTISNCLKDDLTQRIAIDWNEETSDVANELREQVEKVGETMKKMKLQLEESRCGGDLGDKAEKERGIKARNRVRELEKQVYDLQGKLRQKESEHEPKEPGATSYKSHDTGENQESIKLAKIKEAEALNQLAQSNKQNQELQQKLESEKKTRQELQAQFDDFKARNEKLEEKCQKLLEISDKEKQEFADDQHTEYEIQLFNELRETQQLLAEKSETIQKLESEREQILAAMNTDDETGKANVNSKEKLTAELLTKMNELQTLKNQFAQVQKNYKRMQQRAELLEQKLTDMNKLQSQLMKDGSGTRATYEAHVFQLQQQVTDLRSNLAQTNGHNGELEKTITKLQLKLERYKRHLRKFGEDRKLRKEMYMLLQNKDAGVINSEPHLDVQIDQNMADEIEQLYETLEKKEHQVMKLEKLVKQMEKQEECLQVQRTRLENRIAKLEVELKESQSAHRVRGFSFL